MAAHCLSTNVIALLSASTAIVRMKEKQAASVAATTIISTVTSTPDVGSTASGAEWHRAYACPSKKSPPGGVTHQAGAPIQVVCSQTGRTG
jgi:hypothetical protein